MTSSQISSTIFSTEHHLSSRSTKWFTLTPSTPSNTLPGSRQASPKNASPTVGAAVGGVIAAALLAFFLLLFIKRRMLAKQRNGSMGRRSSNGEASHDDSISMGICTMETKSRDIETEVSNLAGDGKADGRNKYDGAGGGMYLDMGGSMATVMPINADVYHNKREMSSNLHRFKSAPQYLDKPVNVEPIVRPTEAIEVRSVSCNPMTRQMTLDKTSKPDKASNVDQHPWKSITIGSIDSGFQSLPSGTECSKFNWPVHLPISGLVKKFKLRNDIEIGTCYNYGYDACMGRFDESGGRLTLECDDKVELVIPPNALDCPTVVYMNVEFRSQLDHIKDFYTESFSPEFNCGPDGLHFKVPVQLTIPSSATEDTDVTCQSQQDAKDDWSEDGCTVVSRRDGMITMDILHFTRFRSASKIPVAMADSDSLKVGKKLVLLCFQCESKLRIYYAENIGAVQWKIEDEEKSLYGKKLGPAKPFIYYKHQGALMIDVQSGSRTKNYKFTDQQVLQLSYNFIEHELMDAVYLVTHVDVKVSIYQPKVGDQMAELVRRIEVLSNFGHPERQMRYTKTTNLTSPSSQYERSISESDVIARTPSESCACNGACSCVHHRRIQSPVENDDPTVLCMERTKKTRQSKESGYSSAMSSPKGSTNNTTKIGPLRGPDELPNVFPDLVIPDQNLHVSGISTLVFPDAQARDINEGNV